MEEIKVDYTLEEIRNFIKDPDTCYEISGFSSTCRFDDDNRLLTASFILTTKSIKADTYIATYTALTKDNYLVTTIVLRDTYGQEVFNPYFGKSTTGSHKTSTLFYDLPKRCQDELVAKNWLARNPATLVEKLKSVLEAPTYIIKEQEKVISLTEEMLVSAHNNMKKQPKKLFTIAWRNWDVMKHLPWFKSVLDKE